MKLAEACVHCLSPAVALERYKKGIRSVIGTQTDSLVKCLDVRLKRIDATVQDVDATVLQAAQANLVTAAAQRVLQACKEAGQQPSKEARASFHPFSHSFGLWSSLHLSSYAAKWTEKQVKDYSKE